MKTVGLIIASLVLLAAIIIWYCAKPADHRNNHPRTPHSHHGTVIWQETIPAQRWDLAYWPPLGWSGGSGGWGWGSGAHGSHHGGHHWGHGHGGGHSGHGGHGGGHGHH